MPQNVESIEDLISKNIRWVDTLNSAKPAPGDVVYAQTTESFLIMFLKFPRGYDFLKQKWNSMTS